MSESERTTRRAFLRGELGQEVASHPVDSASQAGAVDWPASDENREGYLFRMGRRAMACDFEVLLNAGQYSQAAETAFAALDLVEQLESQLTVYRETSEVSQLNQNAHLATVEVEQRLFDLLCRAAQLHDATQGAYDISSGALSKLWGFYQRAGRMPAADEIAATMQRVGMRHVEFDTLNRTVHFRTTGLELNLGSIGKGYALDRAAEQFDAAGVNHFLVHGGHSSIVARGSSGLHQGSVSDSADNSSGWWVGLRHPLLPKRRIVELRLRNQAVGTSGGGTQFFIHEGRRYSHLIDPRTGYPAEGTLSVSVIAPTGAEADALATAFFVMGKEPAIEYCRRHTGIGMAIASPIAGSSRCELSIFGISEDNIRIREDDSILIQRIAQ